MINKRLELEASVMVLGYLQRGGSPTAYDRMMASRMGGKAIDLLIDGVKGAMIGWRNSQLVHLPFEIAEAEKHSIDMADYHLARSLSI